MNSLVGMLLLPLLLAAPAQAQTQYHYDAQGRSAGSTVRSGNTTYRYDSAGRLVGQGLTILLQLDKTGRAVGRESLLAGRVLLGCRARCL